MKISIATHRSGGVENILRHRRLARQVILLHGLTKFYFLSRGLTWIEQG